MSDIFISYASDDREVARRLAERLQERQHDVWWDRTIPPGRVFDEVIQEALTAAKCVVVLWSAHSVRSNWVKVEAEDAAARNRLVPVLIDAVVPPIPFRRIQAANLTGWDGDHNDPEFRSLLASIERLLRTPDATAPAAREGAARHSPGSPRPRSTARLATLVAAIVIVAGAGVWLFRGMGDRGAGTASPAAASATRQTGMPQSGTPQNGTPQNGTPRNTAAQTPQPATQPGAATGTTGGKATVVRGERINLVTPENGGQLIAADDPKWAASVDGDEETMLWVSYYGGASEAIFGFKDGRPATFDTVEILISRKSNNNVAELELLTGDDPAGPFDSVQVFKTRNMLLLAQRFQRFTFPARTARYVKVRVLRSFNEVTSASLNEWRLLGSLE